MPRPTPAPAPTRSRRHVVASVSLLSVLVLTACGSAGGSGASGGSGTSGPVVEGGTLKVAVSSDAGCVDPQQVGSNDSVYSTRQLVDSLTDQDPRTGDIKPWLASSWEVSSDARSFTFHLRTGATFSDGSPVNAAAVKANLDTAPNLGARATLVAGYLAGYQGSTAVDPQTVKVSFDKPNAQFLQATSTFSLGLVSAASTALSPDLRCSKGIVGSGPFVLSSYVPNQKIELSRRAGYAWGSSLWKSSGQARLDKVVFTVVPESGVRSGSLAAGQVDVIGSVGQQDEAAITGAGQKLLARANPGIAFGLSVNNSRPVVSDPAVRRALSLAINRQEVVDTVFPEGTKPATSILSSTTPYYSDLGSQVAFDRAKAAAALDAAGWVPGADGIRVKDGKRLELKTVWFANAATNKPALELIQQQLKDVGVALTLSEQQIANVVKVLSSGDFDLSWGNLTRADPDVLRSQFSTTTANFYHLPATELDGVLAAQATATDTAKRKALVERAQKLIVGNAYVLPVVELTTVLGTSAAVNDLAFDASSRIQLHDTWKS